MNVLLNLYNGCGVHDWVKFDRFYNFFYMQRRLRNRQSHVMELNSSDEDNVSTPTSLIRV